MNNPVAHGKIKVFIVHGKDREVDRLERWLKKSQRNVEAVRFGTEGREGSFALETLEKLATDCDAAIVLATADDVGRLAATGNDVPRARQNVWIEFGWFLARLGKHRTFLLAQENVEIPRDLDGLLHAEYQGSVTEAFPQTGDFVARLRDLPPDSHTELVFISSDPHEREREWSQLHGLANSQLIVTGISHGMVRHHLNNIFSYLRQKPQLILDMVAVDPCFALDHRVMFEQMHRENSVRDNHSFFAALSSAIEKNKDIADRVNIHLLRNMPPFAAVVADGHWWGSRMIVQPFVPHPGRHTFDYARFMLKQRSTNGAFSCYWDGVQDIIRQCGGPLSGWEAISTFCGQVADMRI
jgi:hypothetical protein